MTAEFIKSLSIIQIAGISGPTYEEFFKEVDPDCTGTVSAQLAATFMKRSGLSDSLLSKIWEVADYEKHGQLDKQGFFIALKLIALVQAGKEPLVGNLTVPVAPPAIKPTTPSLPPPQPPQAQAPLDGALADAASLSPAKSAAGGGAAGPAADALAQQADAAFAALGPEAGDRLPGAKVKPFLLQTGLPTATLAAVWDASDEDRDGCLTRAEFRKAFALVRQAKGRALAARTAAQVMAEVDTDRDGIVSGLDVRQLFLQTGLEPATLARIWDQADTGRTGRLTADQFAYAWQLVQAELSAAADGAAPAGGLPAPAAVPLVPQLSDGILAEAARVQQRRQAAEAACAKLEAELRARRAELQLQQREADQLAAACLQLEQQKREAQRRVEEVEERERKLAGSVDECEQRRAEEAAQLEALRARLAQDQAGVRGAAQETERLRRELTSLTQEEARLADCAQGAGARLAGLERELQAESRQLEQQGAALTGLQDQLAALQSGRLRPDEVDTTAAVAAPASVAPAQAVDPFSASVGAAAPADEHDPFAGGADPFAEAAIGGSSGVGVGGAVDFFSDDPFTAKASVPVAAAAGPQAPMDDPFRFDAAFAAPSFADAFGGGGSSDPFGGGGGGAWSAGFEDPFASAVAAPPPAVAQQPPPLHLSEQEQVAWATAESERVAKQQTILRRQEEEEIARALRLSMHEQ